MNRLLGKALSLGAALAISAALLSQLAACGGSDSSSRAVDSSAYGYRVVQVFPHDPDAYTQGLIYRDGALYESTGRNGFSSLRKVRLETGEVLQQHSLDARYFAEGLTDWGDTLVQLTWTSHVGFLYDAAGFAVLDTFGYIGEGWGLTHDGSQLIMSDGTATLRFLDPKTFEVTRRLTVTANGRPVSNLNELEYVKDEILANIWETDLIARISPQTGFVIDWIDLRALRLEVSATGSVDVLNGIAYDAAGDRLFVTGKLWPKLFQIQIEK